MIYLAVEGEIQGPFTLEELRQLWAEKHIDDSVLCWHRGLTQWIRASAFETPKADAWKTPTKQIRVSTTPTIAGEEIEAEIEIVSVESAIPSGVLDDLSERWANILSERMVKRSEHDRAKEEAAQDRFRKLRRACLSELRNEAFGVAADAVVGVSVTYSQVANVASKLQQAVVGHGVLLLVTMVGTAVRLVPRPPPLHR